MSKNVVAFLFLFLGSLLVISLFKSLFKVFNIDKTEESFTGINILKIFALPLLTFVALMIFILFILPNLTT